MVQTKAIYIADDDFDDRMFLKGALNAIDSAIEIIEAENGAELLERFQESKGPVSV